MKIIITEQQRKFISEMIKLDIKVGDIIMGGKFKNKKVVVKTIGKNEKGDITINGKPLLRFRLL
jgi:ABC-type transporter Mla maintaining outer membrane lipid asymmetry ATPase subunit MlaF